MAHPKARLYQRLRSKGFPWVLVEFHKNGSPKPHTDAFQFGVRYSLNGKRKLDPAATLDEALVILKDRNVRLYAQQNGVALPEAAGKRSDSRTVIADAITEYLTTGKAYEKKWSEVTLRCYRDSTGCPSPKCHLCQKQTNFSCNLTYRNAIGTGKPCAKAATLSVRNPRTDPACAWRQISSGKLPKKHLG